MGSTTPQRGIRMFAELYLNVRHQLDPLQLDPLVSKEISLDQRGLRGDPGPDGEPGRHRVRLIGAESRAAP